MHALQSPAHNLITELLGLRNEPLLSKTWNVAVYLEVLRLLRSSFLFPVSVFSFPPLLPSIEEKKTTQDAAQVSERSLRL